MRPARIVGWCLVGVVLLLSREWPRPPYGKALRIPGRGRLRWFRMVLWRRAALLGRCLWTGRSP
ncbi:hypothetical protein ABT340_28610, partial [Streptosporangium sp. NPDC000239]|uniref:hypothetical protein n=1 Tax=Streptosporangium sp. NPDC000239 TaxID=3154248 RepID=UPI00332C6B9F